MRAVNVIQYAKLERLDELIAAFKKIYTDEALLVVEGRTMR